MKTHNNINTETGSVLIELYPTNDYIGKSCYITKTDASHNKIILTYNGILVAQLTELNQTIQLIALVDNWMVIN